MRPDLKHVLMIGTGGAASIVFSSAAALLTTLLLSVDDRGRYVMAITVLAVSAPLAGMGSNVGLRRLLPQHSDPAQLEATYIRLTLGCAAVFAGLGILLVLLFTRGETPRGLIEAGAIGVFGATQVLSWQFVELWFGRLRYTYASTFAVLNASSGLVAALSALLRPTLAVVLITQAGIALIFQIAQLARLRATRPPAVGPRLQRRPLVAELVRTGAPSLVMTGGMSLAFRLDRLMLGAWVGSSAVAVYSLAGSFAELPRIVPAAFGQVANGHAATSQSRIELKRYVPVAAALTILAALASGAVGLAVMTHIDPAYRASITPMIILLLAEVALVPYSIAIRAIMGAGHIGLSARVGAIGMVVSAVLYAALIATLEIAGAAVASLIVYGCISLASYAVHLKQPKER